MPRTFLRPVYDFRDLADKGFRLRPLHHLKTGWQLFKQCPVRFMAFSFLILGVLSILFIPISMLYRHELFGFALFAGLAAFVLLAPLAMGYFIVGKKIMYTEHYSTDTFFSGFQFTVDILKAALLSGLAVFLPLIFATFMPLDGFLPAAFSWAVGLLSAGISTILMTSLVLSYLFIVFSGMPTGYSVRISFMLVRRRLGSFLALLLLLALCNLLGLMFFGLGLLISLPVTHLTVFGVFNSLLEQNRELSRGQKSRDLRFFDR